MSEVELRDFQESLPESMPVAVIFEKRPSNHPWLDFSYQAVGVVSTQASEQGCKLIHRDDSVERYLFSGLELKLHEDECESYYHNLMSPQPGCFIVAEQSEDVDTMPEPWLVSLSFDEVHSYLEGDQEVYAVDIPPELYKWSEAYILTHYVAIKKTKRKLTDWREQSQGLVLHSDSRAT